MSTCWDAERSDLAERKSAQQQLEAARREVERAQRSGDWARAGQLVHGEIPRLEVSPFCFSTCTTVGVFLCRHLVSSIHLIYFANISSNLIRSALDRRGER